MKKLVFNLYFLPCGPAEGGFVKRTVLFTLLCLTLAPGIVWGNAIGTTNPFAFHEDFINWCQFDCTGSFDGHTSPQPWTSNIATGTIEVVHSGGTLSFYGAQQGPRLGKNWVGNFPGGMGVIYNGFIFHQVPGGGIRITFDSPVEGVGAYIEGTEQGMGGGFTATITLLDQHGASLGDFMADGVANQIQGTALFIGAYDVGPIFGVQFDVTDAAGNEDFALGTLRSGPFTPIPEPSSLLLFASSAFGVAGVIRRRLKGVL